MKNFRWILLAGLLVTAPQLAHAQPPSGPGSEGTPGTAATADTGAVSNGAATTTTTTTTAVLPDSSTGVSAEDAATDMGSDSKMGNTGGEPMLVVLAGLSVAAMAFGLRRKVGSATA